MSMIIQNDNDLRIAYQLLYWARMGGKHKTPKAAELKQRIRSFHKRPHNSRIIKDDGMDGYVELIQLPECLNGVEKADAEEWFDNCCTHGPINSPYDCTGRPFTNWFKVFRRCGSWYAYHSVGFDV